MIETLLVVEQIGKATKFTNNSEFDIMISILPIPPKRKILDKDIIPYKTFLILDGNIDLSNVCLSFRKRCV